MSSHATVSVRISLATPEADLAASVWPGVSTIYYPRAESAQQIQHADALVRKLERLRGIRPGTIEIRPMIESPTGAINAAQIGSSSARVRALGVGPSLHISLGVEPTSDSDAVAYVRSECELAARALGLDPLDTDLVLD